MKQAISLLMAILKAKSLAMKSKASAVKTRFIIFKLLHDKNALIGVFPHKKNELSLEEEQTNSHDKTIILQDDDDNATVKCVEEKYNNLQDDAEFDGDSGERDGEFDLGDDEIDQAADVFIRKFHKEMLIQKQESFKMYQEMLASGV